MPEMELPEFISIVGSSEFSHTIKKSGHSLDNCRISLSVSINGSNLFSLKPNGVIVSLELDPPKKWCIVC